MALHSGYRTTPARPSVSFSNVNTASNPGLGFSHSTAMARKASLNALTGGINDSPPSPTKPVGGDGREIHVGDAVNVPGNMHGLVKFIGQVRGKKGIFAGVELVQDFADRGKNDGQADGVSYFKTTIPGAGIFLPIHRAVRRSSASASASSPATTNDPPTPKTPDPLAMSTATTIMPKFSQSVGPGLHSTSTSPHYKPKQLSRPESPIRKSNPLGPSNGRASLGFGSSLSKSQIGSPRYASPVPKPLPTKTPQPHKSRTNSRSGSRVSIGDPINHPVPITAPTRSSDGSGVGSISSSSAFTPMTRRSLDDAHEEISRLKRQLDDRDRQLKDQAATLAEMETSLGEIQSLMPDHTRNQNTTDSYQDPDTENLRSVIRDKNKKIADLIAEFDNHRADFRETIDTLELASTETQRVYEKKVEDLETMLNMSESNYETRVQELLKENKDLQDRNRDVENVSKAMKQLEEAVQELEEGLEDARRGEAEARGEVEFLRGEVERTKAELARERAKVLEQSQLHEKQKQDQQQKAQSQLPPSSSSSSSSSSTSKATNAPPVKSARDLEQRDDEIRGLKAIIHSLSSEFQTPTSMQDAIDQFERKEKELEQRLKDQRSREEDLQREIEKLQRSSMISTAFSDRTMTQDRRSSGRDSRGTVVDWTEAANLAKTTKPALPRRNSNRRSSSLATMAEVNSVSSKGSVTTQWCEICETSGHDILNCGNMDGAKSTPISRSAQHTPMISPSAEVDEPLASLASGNSYVIKNNGPAVTDPSDIKTHFKNASISSQDPDKPRPLAMGKKSPGLGSPLPPLPGMAPSGPLPLPIVAAAATSPSPHPSQSYPTAATSATLPTTTASSTPATSPAYTANNLPASLTINTNPGNMTSQMMESLVPGKDGTRNASKWCAICEHDGHDSINCPMEDQF